MSKDKGISIFDELDSRLDDFFADDEKIDDETSDSSLSDDLLSDVSDFPDVEEKEAETVSEKTYDSKNGPLDSLKAIVLEMDWEISDENLTKYLNEIERLKNIFLNDRAMYLFFKLLSSIGKYMLCKKASANQDALKFLYQVFNSLEKAVTRNYSSYEKNKLILTEVNRFKNLKARMFPATYSSIEMKKIPEKQEIDSKLDFSKLPNEIQNEINNYIEREIASKIQALKNDLINH